MIRTNSLCKPFHLIGNFGFKCIFCLNSYNNNVSSPQNISRDIAYKSYINTLDLLHLLMFGCLYNSSITFSYNNDTNNFEHLCDAIRTGKSNESVSIEQLLKSAADYRNKLKNHVYPQN